MKRYFHITLLAASLILATQLTVSPLIHNHPLDFKDHFDCPAYVISTTLLSFFVFLFVSLHFKSPLLQTAIVIEKSRKTSEISRCGIFNKAPPTLSAS